MDVDSMTVADLKRELKSRNLAVKGAKAELVQRLKDALLTSEKELDEGQLPDGDLSDDGELLNEDELLKETPAFPLSKKDIHPPAELKSAQVENSKSTTASTVVKTAAALQKEGVLQSMEDDLFSDRPAPPSGPIAPAPEVTADKLKARAARFGLPEAKLEERAKKFGSSNKMVAPVEDKQKLMERAKRFGLPVDEEGRANTATTTPTPATAATTTAAAHTPKANATLSAVDLEKLRKRAERFGGNVSSIAVKLEEAEKLAKRKAKFTEEQAARDTDLSHEKTSVKPSDAVPSAPKRKPIVF